MGVRHLLILTILAGGLAPSITAAGPIERACLKADRKAATRPLCNCVQQVADLTLNGRDQRLAASFFSDPHRAQEVRQSDRSSHEAFWKRYKTFGANAESYCRSLRS